MALDATGETTATGITGTVQKTVGATAVKNGIDRDDADEDAPKPVMSIQPESSRCFVGIGSNLGDSVSIVKHAIKALGEIPSTHLVSVSRLYRTKAVGPGEQNDYVNGVAELLSALEPHALLDALQCIENSAGRVRLERWGPRTLDLDLLLYGDKIIATARLDVPHPRMIERNFVIAPLCDLVGDLRLPSGESVAELQRTLGVEGIAPLEEDAS